MLPAGPVHSREMRDDVYIDVYRYASSRSSRSYTSIHALDARHLDMHARTIICIAIYLDMGMYTYNVACMCT